MAKPCEIGILFVSVAAFALAACSKKTESPNAPGAAQSGPMSAAASGGGGGRRGNSGPIAVVARTVSASEFAYETEALGTAKANEAVDITAKTTNRVVAFHFREGELVKKDEVLVEFDGNEARANLAAAEAALKDSKSQYDRSRELYNSKALSASQLEQLEATMLTNQAQVDAARARVNDTVIKAPFSGKMGLRNVSVGSLVTPGQVITTLDDTSVIKLDFTIPETFLAALAEGQQVEAKSATYPDEVFRGRVATVGTRVDSVSRSAMVRALIVNQYQKLKPGMFMTVHVSRAAGEALMIPEQALMPESSQQYVYVVRDGVASKEEVTIGRRRPGEVEVQKGLSVGDVVVVEGGEKLRDGAAVKVVGDPPADQTKVSTRTGEAQSKPSMNAVKAKLG